MLLLSMKGGELELFLVIMTVWPAVCCVMKICKCKFLQHTLYLSSGFLTETYDTRLLLDICGDLVTKNKF